jgi:proline iminopeptidase
MTPDAHTIQETFVEVGDGHTLYMQEWGNPRAIHPIIFLHGGPGAGCSNSHKQSFDPLQQRVIFFDQRGSGRSVPYGSLQYNTTADLVEDIEKIARHCKLDQFVLTGGSWGSCLALAYALEYPKRVQAMVLRGIFTGAQAEVDYFDKGGFRNFFPEAWERLLAATPKSHHNHPTNYHFPRILGDNDQAMRESGHAYESMEGALLRLDDRFSLAPIDEFDPTSVRIEVHYLANDSFMPERHILKNAHKLHMPIWLIQGRYDFVCPPVTAHELHQLLPDSQLIWTTAGHSGGDRSNYDAARTILLQFGGVQK